MSRNTRQHQAGMMACTALSLGLSFAGAVPAAAEPARGALGGGFIEFLMTGSTPTHRQGAPARPLASTPQRGPDLYTGSIVGRPVSVASRQSVLPIEEYDSPAGLEQTFDRTRPGIDPQFERQEVDYPSRHAPGTVVVDTPNRFLYLVQANGRALRYGIGVGRPGFEWAGVKSVTRKAQWPDWRPPEQMLKRRPDLPRFMPGGPENPLGARALYLGSSLYRIHGTNEPYTIGRAVSSGCIRMRNEDVVDLYEKVRVGSKVVVI
ncbi:YkuD_like domain containing protein [Rhabdaerophilaceae bacterium]